jgi:HTH-type transcriptional regulator/antitoxin HigA
VSELIVASDRRAKEVTSRIAQIDEALTSESVLRALVRGLPHEVISGVRQALTFERHELAKLAEEYEHAKGGKLEALKTNDPGAFLILARIARGLSQKDLARKLGLREQAVQRYEAERYRSIGLQGFQRVCSALGVEISFALSKDQSWQLSYDVTAAEAAKIIKHAHANGWISQGGVSPESDVTSLLKLVGEHVGVHGTPSLLRTGLNVQDRSQDWSLLAWKAQVSRRAGEVIAIKKPTYSTLDVSWLMDLVHLSTDPEGPKKAVELLLEHGIVVIVEKHIPGMTVDGAAFLIDDVPVIGLTLLRDTLDNFWFTLLHEVAHVILHFRMGLSGGFFDDFESPDLDELEAQANDFAGNLLVPNDIWRRSPARISKDPQPVEQLAKNLGINPAIIFGRIRNERKDYSIFSSRLGRGTVRAQLLEG